MSKACALNHDFFKVWSPEMAYILGYFTADGTMVRNSRGSCYIEFTSTDCILIEQLRTVTGSDHAISIRERGANCKTAYRIQLGSREWFADLSALGYVQHKSTIMQFPEVPERYLPDFVRGYFDGDGCVYFKQHWSKERRKDIWVFSTCFTSGSRDFLESLHRHLRDRGLKGGRIATKERGFELVFSRRDSLALYRLMYHTVLVPSLFLPRKREKLERAIEVLGL